MRKTCWPRLRNWTTAMRMWCNTRTMLAAARPPLLPGPRSARPQQLRRSALGSALVPPRPRPRPAPGLQAPPTSPLLGTALQRLPKIGPHPIPVGLLPSRPSIPKSPAAGRLRGFPLFGRLSAFAALRLSHRHSPYVVGPLPESRALSHHILSPSLGLQ